MWSDKWRISRAFLRFQLYCELFHQPHNQCDGKQLALDWEQRIPEQRAFWLRYEWWEVEEVKCLYATLVFCLQHVDPYYATGLAHAVEGKEQEIRPERGMMQLRHFLDPSSARPGPFGLTYLHLFLAHQFEGFIEADPTDYTYFSEARYGFRNHFAFNGGTRKWPPSLYPGVQFDHMLAYKNMPRECKRVVESRGDVKKFLRLVGWVFWGSSKIHEWLEEKKGFETFVLESERKRLCEQREEARVLEGMEALRLQDMDEDVDEDVALGEDYVFVLPFRSP
jgi:hypothetical protein